MAQYAARNMEVTIVIPVYNRVGFLEETLRSIPVCYPLIVVDNASTDGTLTLAERLCCERNMQSGAAMSMVISETERGAAAARNCGLAHCTTEWIYFFDSDDVFTGLPDMSVLFRETADLLDMVCFPVRMIVNGRERVRDFTPNSDAATHILNSMLNTISMLFRTEWLRSIGGWDNRCRIWDDWELGLRALLHHPRLQWVTEQAYHHVNFHDDSITGPSFRARSQVILEALKVACDDVSRFGDCRTRRALDLRIYIVCGQLRREGLSREITAQFLSLITHPTWIGRCIEQYVSIGGRGAWRIAIALISNSSLGA